MGWKCFKFWFTIRLLLALLAHFNWLTAFYMKCMYFTFWKSYDLLWFWTHLILCICIKALRPENYLLVWINLIKNKINNPQKSFRQIYNKLYNTRFTKSERRLKEIEIEEKSGDEGQDSDDDFGLSVINENDDGSIYPSLKSDSKNQIRLQKLNNEDDALLEVGKRQKSASNDNDDDKKSTSSKLLDKALPSILKKRFNLGDKAESFTEETTDDDEEKLRKQKEKEARKAQKARIKEEQKLRKEQLRKQALIERRRKNIADSIDLMLQCLRSFSQFALLVGNIHRHFMPPSPYVNPNETVYNDPDLLMLFTITMSLDMFLFWITLLMTYCKQCRLCLRLGICKFWLWLATLIALMFGAMYSPMHYIHQQLDPTWCVFMPGTDLSPYLEG